MPRGRFKFVIPVAKVRPQCFHQPKLFSTRQLQYLFLHAHGHLIARDGRQHKGSRGTHVLCFQYGSQRVFLKRTLRITCEE